MNGKKQGKADQELEAIGVILRSLEGLEGESIQRVLDYVFDRLSINRQSRVSISPAVGVIPSAHPLSDTSGARVTS